MKKTKRNKSKKGLLIIGPHHIGDNFICILSLCEIFEHQIFDPILFITNIDVVNFYADLFPRIKFVGIPPVYSTDFQAVYYGLVLGWKAFSRKFEFVLDLRSDVTAGLIMLLCQATKRWGGDFWLTQFASTVTSKIHSKIQFAHEYYAYRVAQALSQPVPNVRIILKNTNCIQHKYQRFSSTKNDSHSIILCPGASILPKRWPEDRWAQLANVLVGKGFKVEFVYSSAESFLINKIKQFRLLPNIRFHITATIHDAAAILSKGIIAVTCDSALSHLSFLIGTPVITIFGPSQSHTWFPYHLVNSGVAVTRDSYLDCYPCQRRHCRHKYPCIERIPVQDVITAIETMESKL